MKASRNVTVTPLSVTKPEVSVTDVTVTQDEPVTVTATECQQIPKVASDAMGEVQKAVFQPMIDKMSDIVLCTHDQPCQHCQSSNGKIKSINHGPHKPAHALNDNEVNRVPLPGDKDYRPSTEAVQKVLEGQGVTVHSGGAWT